jgi:hypothetical protein
MLPPAFPPQEIIAALDAAAKAHRIPSVVLRGLAWKESRWQPDAPEHDGRVGLLGVPRKDRTDAEITRLRSDWRYNIAEGAKRLELMWNRAPILGNGRLEDGRNILECWYFALGRYGVGINGTPESERYSHAALNAIAESTGVLISRPSPESLAWGRNAFGIPAPWHFGDVAPRPTPKPVVELNVPYLSQVWDSPDDWDGTGSCGPASLTMLLAYFKKIGPKPANITDSYPHTSPLGGHIPALYAAVCEPGLGAVHSKMLNYLRPLFPGVAMYYNEKATWKRVKAELDAGRPVLLGTQVTPAGHLMVVRGYASDGRLIVNDPAGNRELAARWERPDGEWSKTGGRYWNGEGRGALYDWDALEVRWAMTFGPVSADADRPEDG